jgi:hypothetical protein
LECIWLFGQARLDRQSQSLFLARDKDHIVGGCELPLFFAPPGSHDALGGVPWAEQNVSKLVCHGPAQDLIAKAYRESFVTLEFLQRLHLHSGKIVYSEADSFR